MERQCRPLQGLERENLRGREAISSAEYTDATTAYNRLLNEEMFKRIIDVSDAQVMVVGEAEINGIVIPIRCLLDLVPDKVSEFQDCLVDSKTSRNASKRVFGRQVFDLRWHWQAAFDIDLYNAATGEQRSTWFFMVQENYRPFETARHILGADYLNLGRQGYTAALHRYAECLSSGKPHADWPGYNDEPEAVQGCSVLEPEPWMVREDVTPMHQPVAEPEVDENEVPMP